MKQIALLLLILLSCSSVQASALETPPKMLGQKMIYDPVSQNVILFGGSYYSARAIIDLILYRALYARDTPLKEMNDARRMTENTELDKIADGLGFEKYLFLEESVDEKIRMRSVSFGSDSLEALVGAIFLDEGFAASQRFVEKWILHNMPLN